jgi:hypothetical protein
MSPLQPPSHVACDWAAILSIWAASAGRDVRHAAACFAAAEPGSTYSRAPASGRAAVESTVISSTRRLRSQPAASASFVKATAIVCGPSASATSAP